MATRKSLETRRKIAGKILHISKAEGIPHSAVKREAGGAFVRVDEFNELLTDAKRLAGSILSSKEKRPGLVDRILGRSD